MKKLAICLTVIFIAALFTSGSIFATEITAFGPKTYLRTKGAPNIYNDTFSAFDIQGELIIRNGRENDKHRVTSAVITINGAPVFVPRDFKQHKYLMTCPINLAETNTLEVELRSKPGTYLEIEIRHEAVYPTVSLQAEPASIVQGETATLSWTSTDATTCSISPDIGDVATSGTMPVSPEQTTTYTITATGLGGTETAQATVTVVPVPTVDFTVTPDTVTASETADLTWSTTNADTVTGRQTAGDTVTEETLPASGSSTVAPQQTTTYTIIAAGPGGETAASATVTVVHPAPEVSITASPPGIYQGGTSALSWSAANATDLTIDNGIGAVTLSGDHEVSPDQTTTYTLTATGPGGTATASATVSVSPAPPQIAFVANPEKIYPNDTATLIWDSFNANTCEITPDIGPVDLDGTHDVTLSATTTYTITTTGPGGTVTADTTVIVTGSDLLPVHLDTSQAVVDPQTLELSGSVDVEIENTGSTVPEEGFDVLLFEDMDHNETYTPDIDKILGTQASVAGDPLPGGNTLITVPVANRMIFTDNRIFAIVDSNDTVMETDETNNITHSMADCEFIPPVGGFDPVLEWAWTGSSEHSASYNVASTPAVANLNDDNNDGMIDNADIPDILFISYRNSNRYFYGGGILRTISGDGSGELFSVIGLGFQAGTGPVVGDIDNDSLVEIILISGNYKQLIALEHDGTVKWRYPLSSVDDAGPVIADIDTDGTPEIILGRRVINADGTERWIGEGGNGKLFSIVADIDMDGTPEVVAGNTAYRSNGDIMWQNQSAADGYTATGNFDDDPYPEIVLIAAGYAYLLEHTGEIKWGPIDFPRSGTYKDHGGPPTVADFDQDGLPEIGIAGGYQYVVLEHDGSVKWSVDTEDDSSYRTGSSVFDFEGDGSAEVIYCDEHYLRIYRGTDGAELFSIENSSRTRSEYPVIVDVDNDNNAEIVLVSNNDYWGNDHGIRVYGDANDTWVNTRKIWNQHAYCITNVNDDGTIPQYAANNWETFNNFRQNEMADPFGCTDLSAGHIRTNRTALPDAIDLIGRVGNGGALHVAPGVNVSFYNGDPAADGVLIGTTRTATRIYPGMYEDVTFTWEAPTVDLHTIYMQVDDDGAGLIDGGHISETTETNNTVHNTINTGNSAPVADAGPDGTVFIDDLVILDGSGSYDPEGASLTYAWTMVSRPDSSQSTLSDPSIVDPSFTPDLEGAYTFQLVVNDGLSDSGVSLVTIQAGPEITVPDLAGRHRIDAQAILAAAGLGTGAITSEYHSQVPEGYVITQAPVPGAIVATGTPVDLTVSLGVRMLTVPDLRGMDQTGAQTALTDAGLTLGELTEIYSDAAPAGHIVLQDPAPGASVAEGSAVDMTLSLGVWTGVDIDPPAVQLFAQPETFTLGQSTFITLYATDNAGVTEKTLTIDGTPVPLDGDTVDYEPAHAGFITVEATAADAAGHIATDTLTLSVANPDDTVAPAVFLDGTDCPDVTDLYAITGSVSDISGLTYTLAARPDGGNQWQTFASGSGTSISGELGVFDPSIRPNGVYEIRLQARDLSGNTNAAYGCVLVDGNLKLGALTLPQTDLTIPAPGMPVVLERVYDSRITDGDFGPGWQLPASTVKADTTRDLGSGWTEEIGGGFFVTYYLVEQYRHLVVIRFSDEEVLKFKMDVSPGTSTLIPYSSLNLTATFTPEDGTQGSLVPIDMIGTNLMLVGGQLREYGTDLFQPQRFQLTRPDGTVYILNRNTGIERITDIHGHTVEYTENSI
ncbi:MAG: PASTA domain-containing protein, partial [Thermodesulfobacteriota bacterium]|nr:PASTA domain-containing protein [Thermodesulfobacteriota bacterium]